MAETIETHSAKLKLAGAALLAALVALVYAPAFQAGFFWDDRVWLWDNPVIYYGEPWWRYFVSPDTPDYFPISSLMFYLQWQLFGRDPLGYHVVNIVEHALACIVLWRVFVQLRMRESAALAAAALFAVHPLAVSSVCWITEQKNTLSMLAFAATAWCYLQFDDTRKMRWYVGACALFVAGLLCKTSGVALPLVLLGGVWIRRGRLDWRGIAPLLGVSLVMGLVTVAFQDAGLPQYTDARPEGFASRLAAAGWAVWFYIHKIVWPAKLMMVYPRWSVSGASPAAHLPWLALVAILIVLWRQQRAAAIVLASFIVMLAPVLGLVAMAMNEMSLVADHWVYPALPIAGAAVAAVVTRYLPSPRHAMAVLAVMVLTLSVISFKHARLFRSEKTVWEHNLRLHDQCWAAYHNLGVLAGRDGDNEMAIEYLRKTVALNPNLPSAYGNLGHRLTQIGQLDQAIEQLRTAVKLYPDYARGHSNLGAALARNDQVDEALKHLRIAVDLQPRNTTALTNLGAVYMRKQDAKRAEALFRKALELNSDVLLARRNLALALQAQQRFDEAAAQFEIATRQRPDDPDLHYRLGLIYGELRRFDKAIKQFDIALRLDPDNREVMRYRRQAQQLLQRDAKATSKPSSEGLP